MEGKKIQKKSYNGISDKILRMLKFPSKMFSEFFNFCSSTREKFPLQMAIPIGNLPLGEFFVD